MIRIFTFFPSQLAILRKFKVSSLEMRISKPNTLYRTSDLGGYENVVDCAYSFFEVAGLYADDDVKL
jgi:hypothetical protein